MDRADIYDPFELNEILINIVTDDGRELKCVLTSYIHTINGSYVALLPIEKKYLSSGKLLVYKLDKTESKFITIFCDAEYEYAKNLLQKIAIDQGYNKILNKYRKMIFDQGGKV